MQRRLLNSTSLPNVVLERSLMSKAQSKLLAVIGPLRKSTRQASGQASESTIDAQAVEMGHRAHGARESSESAIQRHGESSTSGARIEEVV